jgi:acyl-CoA synthetase (AMP-forming)/AMP-acid ligase II
MTYRDLQRQIDAFAHGMQGAKFGPQHKIVIWAKDCAENVVAQLGAAKAGVTVEVLGDGASAAELEKALSGARALLFSPTLLPEEGALKTVRTLIPELDGLPERADQLVYSAKFPNLRWVFNTGFERVPGMLKFEYILAYKKENPTTASMGSIAFAGPGSKKDLSIPYLDPEAKTPVVEPSREVA